MSEKTEKRGGIAGTVDAVTEAGAAVAQAGNTLVKWTPEQILKVIVVGASFSAFVLVAVLLAACLYMAWRIGEDAKSREAAQIRDCNSQTALADARRDIEAEKVRRDNAELVKAVATAFTTALDKYMAFQAQENAAFRREFLAHLKSGGGP